MITPIMKRLYLISIFILFSFVLHGQDRIALVIGNGDYQVGPLTNPANDAEALAAVLEESGFEVILSLNRTLQEMDDDLRNFKRRIGKDDMAMLFYAGHGVQDSGINYLLPVDNEGILDRVDLKRKAMDLSDYVQGMADAGVRLSLIVLDACRNNPLPITQSSRGGGDRGLSVVSTPSESETVIVFATKAGSVAEDGTGRNSWFTKALLEELIVPDQGLMDMFNAVGAKVRTSTENRQIPTIYSEPLSTPFYFRSSADMAARAEAVSAIAREELSVLDSQIEDLQRRMENTQDEQVRKTLQLEQQRQRALEEAKRQEFVNLANEAERLRKEAILAEQRTLELAANAEASMARQEELNKLASLRREELNALTLEAAAKDPDTMIEHIEKLHDMLSDIDGVFEETWIKTLAGIETGYDSQFAALKKTSPEIWQTDEEFQRQVRQEQTSLTAEMESHIASIRDEEETNKRLLSVEIQDEYDRILNELHTTPWEFQGQDIRLILGEYDRDKKIWPFTLQSKTHALPLPDLPFEIDFSRSSKEELISFDEAVKSDGLNVKIVTRLKRNNQQTYNVLVESLAIENLLDGSIVWRHSFLRPVAIGSFTGARRNAPRPQGYFLQFNTSEAQQVLINGNAVVEGQLYFQDKPELMVEMLWDENQWFSKTLLPMEGKYQQITLDRPVPEESDYHTFSMMVGLPMSMVFQPEEDGDIDETNWGTFSLDIYLQSWKEPFENDGNDDTEYFSTFFKANLISPYLGFHFDWDHNGDFALGPQGGIDLSLGPLKFAYANVTPLWRISTNDYSLRFAMGLTFFELFGIEYFFDPFSDSAPMGLILNSNFLYGYGTKFLTTDTGSNYRDHSLFASSHLTREEQKQLKFDRNFEIVGNGLLIGGATALAVSLVSNIFGRLSYSLYQEASQTTAGAAWSSVSTLSRTSVITGVGGLASLVTGALLHYFSPDTSDLDDYSRILEETMGVDIYASK